jgi:uncharacterized protein (DUF305 family)
MTAKIGRWLAIAILLLLPILRSGTAHAQSADAATPRGTICGVIPAAATPLPVDTATTGTPIATPVLAADRFDLAYIDLAIATGDASVAIAEIASEQAEHPELREFAATLVGEQAGEIAQLQSWRDAWYPNAESLAVVQLAAFMNGLKDTMLDAGDLAPVVAPDESADVVALCNATDSFDLAVLDAIIPLAQSDVTLANIGLEHGTHDELNPWEQSIIDARQKELDQLRAWRQAWAV